jgi:hypothetical protein
MAQFIPFSHGVEVNGQTILSFVHALPSSQATFYKVLGDHGLSDIYKEGWFSQEKWLHAFKEIYETLGPNTLFMIGKAIPENAIFPDEIDSLEKALSSIDVAYHMNHRGGEIGYYQLSNFDLNARMAIMECKNPYPSDFDRGIIMTMLRRFLPKESVKHNVVLDTDKPTRLDGGEQCTYIVSW